jgi:hypothetical protein
MRRAASDSAPGPGVGNSAPVVITVVLLGAAVFGAADQYLGSFPTITWGIATSLLSAPWLLLAFLAGWTQRRAKPAALLGLAATFSALAGYMLMTLSPVEGAQLTWDSAAGFVYSSAKDFLGAVVTGPLFGWFGHRWRVARDRVGALVTAAAFALEPLAHASTHTTPIASAIVTRAEIAAGLLMAGYVAFAASRRRHPAPRTTRR